VIDYLEYIANISKNTAGENHYLNILYYAKIKWRERGRYPGIENDRRGRLRELPTTTSVKTIIEYYMKIKGQITSERISSDSHDTHRTRRS
jgi:hypothetical protein